MIKCFNQLKKGAIRHFRAWGRILWYRWTKGVVELGFHLYQRILPQYTRLPYFKSLSCGKYILTAVILSLVAFPVQAEDSSASSDPTLEIIFSHLPEIENKDTRQMVSDYTKMAKTFWIQKKCERLEGNAEKEFVDNLAKATEIVRTRFKKEFDVKLEEAQKHAEILQMWALNEVSAKKIKCDAGLNEAMVFEIVNSRNFLKKYQ